LATVLVVEDNQETVDAVTRFLQREGYRVLHAPDGVQGVTLAKTQQPDLILMDLGLPEMNGWEATAAIRAHAPTAHVPIIAVTAHALAEDVSRAMEAGCDSFVTKPVVYPRLMRKIRGMLGET
jgi:two-component system, cell cycle response regulator DivK